MGEFNKREKTSFDVKVASIGALDAIKQQKARVCPLVCGKGFKVEEDHCIAISCTRGFVRDKATGECERETKAAASPPAAREESGSGQIFCDSRTGCRPVPKGCRIDRSVVGVHGSGGGQTLVCN
jgi:hypothetical protein